MSIRRLIPYLLAVLFAASPAFGQTMKTPEDMASTGYFRDQDTMPGGLNIYRQLPGGRSGLWGLGPNRQKIRRSSVSKDAHENVADFSPELRCRKCHIPETKALHGLRMGITCVQCHRSQPVAGIHNYYSPLNPIRRHAYVCAKCHEGATPSFASYMVHEPNPLSYEARSSFPLLFYAVWIMLILAVGVFVFFLPYTVLWWIRELVAKLKGRSDHG